MSPPQKCEHCAKYKAAFKIIRIEDGVATQVNVCHGCAGKMSAFHQSIGGKTDEMDQLLELLTGSGKHSDAGAEGAQKVDPANATCPSCGIEIGLYRTTGMLGCPDCYDAFADELEQDMQRLHGATRHVGAEEHPAMRSADLQKRLAAMREELVSAVEFEDFERAAFLRDAISQAEKELADGGGTAPKEAAKSADKSGEAQQ